MINDIYDVVAHAKKEVKCERKSAKESIDEIAEERSCNNCLYFESRKGKDLFLWMMKSPQGPSFKFMVQNMNTCSELKLTGNNLKGSRPLLSFDAGFESAPIMQLMKEMLTHSFGTPRFHPKSKPFYDHVFSFNYHEGKIYFRNYQIVNEKNDSFKNSDDISKLSLVEIGPRFSLVPIKAFDGTMGGEALWQNTEYISPTKLRGKKYDQFLKKRVAKEKRKDYYKGLMDARRKGVEDLNQAFQSEESD